MKVPLKRVVPVDQAIQPPAAAPRPQPAPQPVPTTTAKQPSSVARPAPSISQPVPAPAEAPTLALPLGMTMAQYTAFLAYQEAQGAAGQSANQLVAQEVTGPGVMEVPEVTAEDLAAAGVAQEEISTPEDANEARTIAPRAARAIAPMGGNSGAILGEWSASDILHPRLQIVQGNGELAKRYAHGTLLLADDVFLDAPNATNPSRAILFVPVQMKKQYREVLSQEQIAAGLKPRTAFSKEEVQQLGGSTEWGATKGQKPDWKATGRFVLLVKQPDGVDHPAFSEVEGMDGRYALCVYYAAGVAYETFAKVILTAAASTLSIAGTPYLPKRWWTFTVEPRKWGPYSPFGLIAKQKTEDTSDAVRDYANGFVNATVRAEGDED